MSLFKGGSVVFTVHEADNGYVAEITQSGRPLVVIGKTLSECVEAAVAGAASIRVMGRKKAPPDDDEDEEADDEDVAIEPTTPPIKRKKLNPAWLKAWEDGAGRTTREAIIGNANINNVA